MVCVHCESIDSRMCLVRGDIKELQDRGVKIVEPLYHDPGEMSGYNARICGPIMNAGAHATPEDLAASQQQSGCREYLAK